MACKACDLSLNPQGPRDGEHHVGIRFDGDWRRCIYKDGVLVLDCYEADSQLGRLWRYHMPPYRCACGGGTAAYIDEGIITFGWTDADHQTGCHQ